MQNIPFNGAGRRPAPHPLLAIIPSPTAIYVYFIQSALCRICMYCCYTRICSHSWDVKRKYLFNMRGWAGPAPCPLPPLRWRSRRGGGEGGWRAMSCRGILSGEGGISGKQAASWNGKFFWQIIRRIILADESGSFSRQDILAGHFGTFIWRIFTSNEKVSCWAKKKKKKKCTISESVDCIMSLYVANSIMLFCSRCRFNWTSKLWSCNHGYCGSVDLYCVKYTSWRRSLAQFLLFSTVTVFLAFARFHPRRAGSQLWPPAAEGSR